jgi:hypothetical protein
VQKSLSHSVQTRWSHGSNFTLLSERVPTTLNSSGFDMRCYLWRSHIRCVEVHLSQDRAMAQEVSCRPLTGEAWFRVHTCHVRFVVEKMALELVLLAVLRFYSANISFHRRSPSSYHLRVSKMSFGGSRAETWSHPIEIYPLVTKEVHILKSLFKNW